MAVLYKFIVGVALLGVPWGVLLAWTLYSVVEQLGLLYFVICRSVVQSGFGYVGWC